MNDINTRTLLAPKVAPFEPRVGVGGKVTNFIIGGTSFETGNSLVKTFLIHTCDQSYVTFFISTFSASCNLGVGGRRF